MKKKILITAILALMISAVSFAQPGMGLGPCRGKNLTDKEKIEKFTGIPNLTDDQVKKIMDIKEQHLKQVTAKKALLKEKNAHLKVLMTQDKPDQKEIDKTVNEINSIKSDLMKSRIDMQLKIRALLTDEQRVYYDRRIISGEGYHKKWGHHHKPTRK
jgi:Spy/CpxP family protein refolding chaperone